MIATNEAVDILRHGWQDAASTLAGDVPEVAELLQARLEMAVASDHLDERHLLDTIQEVESVTARAGSPSAPDLARRLRRTVYEYLLALDAARPLEVAPTRVDQPPTDLDSPMVGAEEVAALGHATRSREDAAAEVEARLDEMTARDLEGPAPGAATESGDGGDGANAVAEDATVVPTTRRRLRLRRRQRHPSEAMPDVSHTSDPDVAAPPDDGSGDASADAGEPNWQFTPAAEPVVFSTELGAAAEAGPDPLDEQDATPTDAVPTDPQAVPDTPADEAIADTEPGEAAGGPVPTFVAPRAGFHIVEDAPSHRADQDEPPLQMPAFTADEVSGSEPDLAAENADEPAAVPEAGDAEDADAPHVGQQPPELAPAGPPTGEPAVSEAAPDDVDTYAASPADPDRDAATSDFLAWRQPASAPAPEPEHPAEATAAPAPSPPPVQLLPTGSFSSAQADLTDATPPLLPPAPPAPEATSPAPPLDEADGEPRGWGVRRHGEAHAPRGAPGTALQPVEDDPFENNTRLADMRRRIEERLRRKRCDEAAALLQEIAQETGGRAVAELAMNAGDRCRALGKSNAALNCYLAAARSDPVYELPLSRLADVCIDNQDTELAVSYLERIARIYRFREDDKAALRTYRRIATIAPYREDVLTLLMNAQRTGQLQ